MKVPSIILFLLLPSVGSLHFLPPGFSNSLANFINVPPSVFAKISPKCAEDSGVFMNSLFQSAKILETCNETNCLKELEQHIFALKQFDAFGKLPSGISQWTTISDGNYQACQEADGMMYPTNYCYLLLVPGKNSSCPDLSNLSQDMTDTLNIIFKLAVCIPQSCNSHDITTLFNEISSLPLTACQTQCVKYDSNYGFWFWAFIIFMVFMTLISLLGTVLDYYFVDTDDKATTFRILCCFSLYSNLKIIFSTKQKEGHLKAVNFLKFWSVVWVILGHSPVNFLMGDTVKSMVADRKKLLVHIMLDAGYSVETFFVVTGTLLGYGLWKNSVSSQLIYSRKFWLKMIARRYFRLVPPLIIFIGVFMFSSQLFHGPVIISLFDNMNKQAEKCSEVWWINLFMMQNFRRPSDNCYPISWYVAANLQCFLVAPLIVVPMMQSWKQGFKTTSILIISSFFATFFVFSYHSLPPFNYALKGMEEYLAYVHQSSFQRISTFIFGIYLGQTLAAKRFPSGFARNHSRKIWISCGFAIFVCFYGKLLAVADMGEMEMNPILSAAHHIFHRILWVLVIVWVIYSCQYELNIFFSTFINHQIWQPLGKLTYSIYIIHWWMLYVVLNQSDRSLHFVSHIQVILTVTIPSVILCIPTALIWSSIFEVPIGRLEKLFLSGYRSTV